ncbi:MAG TPA: AAA family ATPase, partial [Streptosporangiaceae bacterium]|nr:AAA family ATPase [Streptosporangiaceae bacterium]
QADYAQLQEQVSGREDGRGELTAAREQAAARLKEASASVARLRQAERAASGELAGLRARADALAEAVTSGADASAVLLAQPPAFDGVLGPLATLLTVADGAQEAIAAALGGAAGAVAVDGPDAAVAILRSLRSAGSGQAGLVIAGGSPSPAFAAIQLPDRLPASAVPARDLVQAPAQLAAAVDDLLAGVIVTDDLAAGLELLRDQPGLRLVTRDGDLLGTHWARGGSAGGQSLLSLKAAASQASAQLATSHERSQYAEGQLAVAVEDEEQARQELAQAQAALQQVDAAAAQTSGKLGTLAGAAKAAQGEASRLSAAIAVAERSQQQSLASAAELQARLAEQEMQDAAADGAPVAGSEPGEDAPTRQELDAAATAARAAEMEARLEVRTVEERLRAISGRADALAAAAVAERDATARAHARRELRTEAAIVARAVAEGARFALARIQASAAAADTERQHAEQASKGRDGELKTVRASIRDLTGDLDKVVNSAHGVQMAHATRRMQLEQIAGRVAEEFAIEVDELLADYGPAIPIPPAEEGQLAIPYERAAQEKRAQAAQRMLDQLGKVNPLALEEFAALEERHAFLVTQLEDLRKTRRDLLTVIKEVDDRVLQVFTSAYADTAREFERVFGRLFPGGDGRLILTEPDDMLATGIDFEARPPGKKVKRLSLLSGGERSLTAIAFLVAIFMARPSPFYVLDEVEAALDDTNLGRLLDIFAELRESSQLIIITHQKRTMEVADSLYGISMRGDGVSNVVSQRLRERETA